ncbi:hypothetical protein B0H14DRAFT_3494231 [Mycena olivaceomarginata]|nr:hypothetical protein B0H14DRAFT_3494231 [Mycena olivaceomarginata]
MQIFPEDIQFKKDEKNIVFLAPKFHLPAHIEECNIQFSFNLTRFVGRTDGEAPERGWADANRLANSTKISGPSARRDMLDAHFQYSNWKKSTKLGDILLQRVQRYIPLMLETRAAWVHLEVSFSESIIETWTAMAVAWEADSTQPIHTKPNPFASTVKHEDLAEVRRQLALIASQDIHHEGVRGDMHNTEMLSIGLQLEREQRALAAHMKQIRVHETTTQEQTRIERETKLWRKIDPWMGVQQLFIPEVVVSSGLGDCGVEARGSNTGAARSQGAGVLREYKFKLRKDQAVLVLNEMRGNLLLHTHEFQYRDSVHGVKAKLRSGARTDALQARIDTVASEYQAAHSALVKLGVLLKDTEWQQHLQPLKDADIRGRPSAVFGDDERRKGGSKKKKKQRLNPEAQTSQTAAQVEEAKKMSWIWVSEGTTGTDEDVAESERELFTRVHRDGANILGSASNRVGEDTGEGHFLQWRADRWTSLVGLRAGKQEKLALREGHAAYVRKQAGYMQDLRDRFEHQWRDVARELEVARELYEAMMPDPEEEGGAPGAGEDSGQTNISSGWLLE